MASASSPSRTLYEPWTILLPAVAGGMAIDRWQEIPAGWWWGGALAALGLWRFWWSRGAWRSATVCLLLATACTSGAWRHMRWNWFEVNELARAATEESRPLAAQGVARGFTRRIPAPPFDPLRAIPVYDRSRLEIDLTAVRQGETWQPASGRAMLLVDGHLLGVHGGDRVQVFGQLQRTRPAANPGAFDYAAHARGDRILTVIRCDSPDCVEVRPGRGVFDPRNWLDRLREGGDQQLWRVLRRERSGLAAALLLGVREELEPQRTEDYVRTGTIHVLAISGTHVAILAAVLFATLRLGWFPRGAALLGIAATVVLYTLLTGSDPSAVRAMVLVLIVCGGEYLRRDTTAPNSLAAAAVMVLVWNPADLTSVGAQLSFLSVAALIAFGRWWSRFSQRDPLQTLIFHALPWWRRWTSQGLRWSTALTLSSVAVWLATAPLVLARFNLISPAALLLTPVTWLPAALALLSGFGVLVTGWLFPPLATGLGAVCDANLALLDWCVSRSARTSGSYFWAPGPGLWWLFVWYGMLAAWWAWPQWRPPRRWCVALLAAWCGCGALWPLVRDFAVRERPLECTFLSVGHGCATLVRLPSGQHLLYDVGSLGSSQTAAEAVSNALWERGATHLDAVILTHADVDHYNGLPELLERVSVGVVYVSPFMFDNDTPALRVLRQAIERTQTPLRELVGGQRLKIDPADGQIEVLHPPSRGVIGSDNAQSLVLAIEHQGRRLLLTGDLEGAGLRAVLAEEPWDCDVLLAPHHGSPLSDPPGMAAWCQPEWVIASGGASDRLATVQAAYAQRHATLWHTAEEGAITVTLGPTIELRGWKSGRFGRGPGISDFTERARD